jgi:adenosine deaminase/aminodeoxyfutalosine deaminase
MNDLAAFIRRLPKAELHLHLEGTILPATLVELSRHEGRIPLTPEQAEDVYHFTDFTGFMNAFRTITSLLVTPEDYELAAWRMAQRLAEQGVVHAEVYISVGVIYHFREHDPACFEPIFKAMERARERAQRELNLSIYWIFDAVRHFSVEEGRRVFQKAAELRPKYPSVIGIGLGGDERRACSEPYRAAYAEAKAAGLRLTTHAGETTDSEAIRGRCRLVRSASDTPSPPSRIPS